MQENFRRRGRYCSAFGCSMRSATNLLSEVKMFYFPSDPVRHTAWSIAMRRKNWKANRNSVICNKHFLSGKPSSDPGDPDYVPSQFSFNTQVSGVSLSSGLPGARKVLKRNAIPSLNLPVPSTQSNDKTVLKATLRKIESDERYDSKARLSMKNKDVKKQLETIPKGKNVPVSSNSQDSSIITKSSEELSKVVDTSSEGIETNPDMHTSTVLETNSTKPNSNLTEQNHSDLTERNMPSDFNEDRDSDIATDTDDDGVMNNSENESGLPEESSKCQLEKVKAQNKELQIQLKKYQKQCKLLTNDNDNLRKENAAHMKENYTLMKENDCLKEVINSLRQIISVSDEKYFEAMS